MADENTELGQQPVVNPSAVVAAEVEATTSAPSGGETPVVAQEPPAEATPAAKGPAAPPAKEDPSQFAKRQLDKRVDRLTARLRAAEQALVDAQRAGKAPVEADVQRLVEERASVLAEQQVEQRLAVRAFNQTVQQVVEAGQRQYGKEAFAERIEGLKSIRDESDAQEMRQYDQLVSAIIETGEAPKLIDMLGQNPSEAQRLMGLTPIKLGIELARLAEKSAPQPLTQAPKPIIPLANKGRSHEALSPNTSDGDRLATAEWFKRREEQVREYNKAAGRRVI